MRPSSVRYHSIRYHSFRHHSFRYHIPTIVSAAISAIAIGIDIAVVQGVAGSIDITGVQGAWRDIPGGISRGAACRDIPGGISRGACRDIADGSHRPGDPVGRRRTGRPPGKPARPPAGRPGRPPPIGKAGRPPPIGGGPGGPKANASEAAAVNARRPTKVDFRCFITLLLVSLGERRVLCTAWCNIV